jgi:hypothetical protein
MVGLAERANLIDRDRLAARRDDESAASLLDVAISDRLDAQSGTVNLHLDLAGSETEPIAPSLRDQQSTRPVDGRSHGITVPTLVVADRCRSGGRTSSSGRSVT